MKFLSKKYVKIAIIVGCLVVVEKVSANSEIDRLMDSYIVAKAEEYQVPMSEEELKQYPFTIQVARYINEKDAVSHVEELKLQEKEVKYYPSFVGGQVWFKVSVGKFETREAAESYRVDFVKRMDEPFAAVVSFLEKPKNIGEAKLKKTTDRKLASIVEAQKVKMATPDVSKEQVKEAEHKVEETKNKTEENKHVAMLGTVIQGDAIGGTYYSLQVGAFDSKSLAEKNLASLKANGKETFVKQAEVAGKTWYRAFIGRFNSKNEAESFQTEFKQQSSGRDSLIRKMTE